MFTRSLAQALAKWPERLDQGRQLVVGVQTARVREDPELAPGEALRLRSEPDVPPAERDLVGALSDDRDDPWPEAVDGLPEAHRASAQLVVGELGGRRGRPGDEIRDPDPDVQEHVILVGSQQPGREAGAEEGRPEAVPGSGEVMAGRARDGARIDPDEEQPEARTNDVWDAPCVGWDHAAMVEYGGGISHGPAGQVSGGGGGNPVGGHAGSIDIGSNVSNFFNDAVNTFSAMPLLEQVLLVGLAMIIGFFLLRRVF